MRSSQPATDRPRRARSWRAALVVTGAAGAPVLAAPVAGAQQVADGVVVTSTAYGAAGPLLVVLVLVLVAGVVALLALRRTRAEQAHRETVLGLGAARDRSAEDLGACEAVEGANHERLAALPDHDDLLLTGLRQDHEDARSLHAEAARTWRQVVTAHPLPEEPAAPTEPGAAATIPAVGSDVSAPGRPVGPMTRERAAAATPAYADLAAATSGARAAAERLAASLDDLERLVTDLPARAARAEQGADELAEVLDGLRGRGYRTTDLDHVPDAVRSQADRATGLGRELRVTDAVSLLEGVELDLVEVRRRLADLDEERERVVADVDAVGRRTPGIDQGLATAYRELIGVEQVVAASDTAGLRERLDEGAAARAAVPRLLASAAEDASVEVLQLTRARRRLEEAVDLCVTAERETAQVRTRVEELRQASHELPVSADRTAARAQNLAELAQRHVVALAPWADEMDPHQQARDARALGDEVRRPTPDLSDVARRLDEVRARVAAGEARVEAAVTAYAARQLAVNAARSAVTAALGRAGSPGGAGGAADLARRAAAELDAAEAEVDHDTARDGAAAAGDLAREAMAVADEATADEDGAPGRPDGGPAR